MSSEVFGDIYAQKMKNFDVEATLVNNQYIIGKYIKDCYEYFVPNQEKKKQECNRYENVRELLSKLG